MTASTNRPARLRSVEAPAVKAALVAGAADAAEEAVIEKAVQRRGRAKTGNPSTDRKAEAAKAAKAAPAKAPAKKAPAESKADTRPKSRAMAPKLPNGYAVRYENGAYNLAKKGDGAAADGPAWIVICTEHGTTTTAAKAKEGDALGRKSARPAWCKKCAAA